MSSERHRRLTEVFFGAVETSPEKRDEYLHRECAGDPELQRQVRAMLEADAESSDIDQSLVRPSHEFVDALPIPEFIGRYKVIRLLGEGGMGSVYEAEQDNPKRTVAIKILRYAFSSRSLRRRFESEAQVLGRLQHPGIAQVYEAGTFGVDGKELPYFAMEKVEGEPMLRAMKRRSASLRDRVALLAKTADAIHHAHSKGVIHRDLKPDNVLVDAAGNPKVVDFGIARVVDREAQASTMRTQPGQILGTLAYMSPEQLSGDPDDIDTRSDVYSLGVVGFELLTGRLPYDLDLASPAKVLLTVSEREPKRLSDVAQAIPSDLETIIGKAIAKVRDERYASAAEFAEDLRRFERDEPIQARPPSTIYQLRKFASRNRFVVAAAVAAVVSPLFGLYAAVQDAERAHNAEGLALKRERAAIEESTRANAVSEFILAIFRNADPRTGLGREAKIVDYLSKAARELKDRFPDQPDVKATLHLTLGTTYRELGMLPEAEAQLTDAVTLRRTLATSDEAKEKLAIAINSLAFLYRQTRQEEKAVPLYREALATFREAQHGDTPDTAKVLNNLANALARNGEAEEADKMFAESFRVHSEVLKADDPNLAIVQSTYANFLEQLGRLEEAEKMQRDALERFRKGFPPDHPYIGTALINYAGVLRAMGRPKEALPLIDEAIRIKAPRMQKGTSEIGELYLARALSLLETDRVGEAEQQARETIADFPPAAPGTLEPLPEMTELLGVILLRRDALAEATLLFEGLVDRLSHFGRDQSGSLPSCRGYLGRCYISAHRGKEAEAMLQKAYDGLKDWKPKKGRMPSPINLTSANIRDWLVEYYQSAGDAASADLWRAK